MRTFLYAGFAALLLTGAAASQAQAATKNFSVTLKASEEVPPNSGTGVGTADLSIDSTTKMLTWKITFAGLSSDATMAHIHGPAAAGANAGVVINLAPGGAKSPLEGATKLTDAQYDDFNAGLYYINVHSTDFKNGEIRGQIRP